MAPPKAIPSLDPTTAGQLPLTPTAVSSSGPPAVTTDRLVHTIPAVKIALNSPEKAYVVIPELKFGHSHLLSLRTFWRVGMDLIGVVESGVVVLSWHWLLMLLVPNGSPFEKDKDTVGLSRDKTNSCIKHGMSIGGVKEDPVRLNTEVKYLRLIDFIRPC